MLQQTRSIFRSAYSFSKPKASEVLTYYLQQCNEPPWTSYFIKIHSISNDQWGKSHFNWKVGNSNYHILRTGCYPYIKYHCTKRPVENLIIQDYFFRFIKVLNLGIPCLAYGIAATFLIRHIEVVKTPYGPIKIYFLYAEDKGIPCLAYGMAAIFLNRHIEVVKTPYGSIKIYFLYPEDKGSGYYI